MSNTYRNDAQISVKWNHVDGPMLVRPNGTIKWLSLRERFMHWIGAWSLEEIAARTSQELSK